MPNRVDVSQALELRLKKGLSYQDIADKQGVSKQAIFQALTKFEKLMLSDGEVAGYRAVKPDILESVEIQLLNDLIDPERRQKASLNNTAYALGQIAGMTRLEKGLSTSNVAYQDMNQTLEELQRKRAQLQESIDAI